MKLLLNVVKLGCQTAEALQGYKCALWCLTVLQQYVKLCFKRKPAQAFDEVHIVIIQTTGDILDWFDGSSKAVRVMQMTVNENKWNALTPWIYAPVQSLNQK